MRPFPIRLWLSTAVSAGAVGILVACSENPSPSPTASETGSLTCAAYSQNFTLSTATVTAGAQPTYSWTFGAAGSINVFGDGDQPQWTLVQSTTRGIQPPVQHGVYSANASVGGFTLPGSLASLARGKQYLVLIASTDGRSAACAVFKP